MHDRNDELCTDSDSQLTEILGTASQTTTMACEGNSPYAAITDEFLGERIAEACKRHSESMSWRVFGGPHSAVWKNSEPSEQSRLSEIHGFEQDYMATSLQTINDCLVDNCTPNTLKESRKELRQNLNQQIIGDCGPIEDIIGINAAQMATNLDT